MVMAKEYDFYDFWTLQEIFRILQVNGASFDVPFTCSLFGRRGRGGGGGAERGGRELSLRIQKDIDGIMHNVWIAPVLEFVEWKLT